LTAASACCAREGSGRPICARCSAELPGDARRSPTR
jgi:hypothetical protein